MLGQSVDFFGDSISFGTFINIVNLIQSSGCLHHVDILDIMMGVLKDYGK